MEKTQFELVSPEQLLHSGEVAMVVVPGAEGDFGVLPRHAPMISTVRPGVISVYEDNRNTVTRRIFVGGGFAEVTQERCTVLADSVEAYDEIDRGETERALKDAREDLEDAKNDVERTAAAKQVKVLEEKLRALETF